MHQQTYCHTLPKPFSKIFLFRIYAPTIHSTDFKFGETSVRLTHISAPIQPPQTNPPTTQSTKFPRSSSHTNQSTNDHRRTNQTTDTTLHKYHTHTASTPTYSLHKHTQPHKHTPHSTQARPPTLTLTLTPMPTDVDAAPMQSQPRCTRSHAPVRNWTGQADRIRPYKHQYQTRQDQARPIHN